MTPASRSLPLSGYRDQVLEYLRKIPLPFTSVAGTIVTERLQEAQRQEQRRPSMVLWASDAWGGSNDALPVAAAFAFFDLFVALHDELVETGAATGEDDWGLGQQLNAGDALYALALRTLADDVNDPDRRLAVSKFVSAAVLEAIEGRNVDVERTERGASDTFFARTRSRRRRSAAMTGAALRAGALLAGAAPAAQRAMDRAGRLLDAADAVAATDAALSARLVEKSRAALARGSHAAYKRFGDLAGSGTFAG